MPAGAPRVQVTFLLDANGILDVSARELRSGQAASVQITPAHGLTRDEVDSMVQDSYAHAVEDLNAHRLIDLRNESARILGAIEKACQTAGEVLSDQQRRTLDAAVADLKDKTEGDDCDAVYQAMGAANDAAMPLTEAQMDDVLSQTIKGRKMDDV
jgi:molecular chaperone DnaK (HSP70)